MSGLTVSSPPECSGVSPVTPEDFLVPDQTTGPAVGRQTTIKNKQTK